MGFARATARQIDAVEELVNQCREDLAARQIFQWDASYPNRAYFEGALAAGSLFVLTDADRVTGVVVLDEGQASEWSAVDWQETEGPILVVHSFAVLLSSQGKGYGATMISCCEAFARDAGYKSMRLDAFSENESALRFYERNGYSFQGEIELAFKPAGHQRYYCYEKRLIDSTEQPTFGRPIETPHPKS